jgi:phage terminase Nu1 subunit (DNA packaging protein)
MVEQVRVMVLPDGRVDRKNAAAFLGRQAKTLADWNSKGIGPVARKVGGRVFYYMRDLEAFRDTGAREAA